MTVEEQVARMETRVTRRGPGTLRAAKVYLSPADHARVVREHQELRMLPCREYVVEEHMVEGRAILVDKCGNVRGILTLDDIQEV